MPPTKKAPRARLSGSLSGSGTRSSTAPPAPPHPFKPAPPALAPLTAALPRGPVYIAHVDPRPAAYKRKLFLVPVAINLAVLAAFAWRVWYAGPYYAALLASALGRANATTLRAADLAYGELARVVLRRAATFMLDFVLAVFVWPWPLEFAVGTTSRSCPLAWRWAVGFRDDEVYVRRSRESWYPLPKEGGEGEGEGEEVVGVDLFDTVAPAARERRDEVLARVSSATAPMLMQQKTGYLMMDGDWDLDWRGMVDATRLVDKKEIPLSALGVPVVLLHHGRFGWVTVDLGTGTSEEQDERRKQVFAFRDALAKLGKEDLFFRWVEMIQFETSQPGGFTPAKQVEAAKKIRDMFSDNGIDFDGLWKAAVGTDGLPGMP